MSLPLFGSMATGALLALFAAAPIAPPLGNPDVFPPDSSPYGLTYGEWSANWWTWFMEQPVAGHPGTEDPLNPFDVTAGQTGKVWFLAGVLDPGTAVPRVRTVTIPKGKSLFVALINSEFSSQEGFATEAEQRATANFFTDHAVNLACTIDGRAVEDLGSYRCESPQFSFTAPDPWIFGPGGAGQSGTSVADGYFVFVKPQPVGQHVIHLTGGLHFDAGELGPDPLDFALDMTYAITVGG